MSKIMVFIYDSLVRIENAFFRFYAVLASIFGSQGFAFGTVLGQNVSKMDLETVFGKRSSVNTCCNRFGDHYCLQNEFFVARPPFWHLNRTRGLIFAPRVSF